MSERWDAPGGWPPPPVSAPPWERREPERVAPRRRPWVVAGLSALLVVLGWAYTASYGPGVAPWQLPDAAVRQALVSAPTPERGAVGVATDRDDTLVLLRPAASTEPGPVVVQFEAGAGTLVLRPGAGAAWTVTPDRRPPVSTVAAGDRGVRVIRVPGRPPTDRWSATLAGVRVPASGSAPVAELGRVRSRLPADPVPSAVVALFVALVVAPRAYRSAGRRVLRTGVQSVLFGLLTLVAAAPLVALVDRAVAAPQLVALAAASVVPLVILGVAWALGDGMTPDPAAEAPAPVGVRLATAVVALALVAVVAYLGEAAVARLFPGVPP